LAPLLAIAGVALLLDRARPRGAKATLGVRTERVGFGPGGHFVWFFPRQAA